MLDPASWLETQMHAAWLFPGETRTAQDPCQHWKGHGFGPEPRKVLGPASGKIRGPSMWPSEAAEPWGPVAQSRGATPAEKIREDFAHFRAGGHFAVRMSHQPGTGHFTLSALKQISRSEGSARIPKAQRPDRALEMRILSLGVRTSPQRGWKAGLRVVPPIASIPKLPALP